MSTDDYRDPGDDSYLDRIIAELLRRLDRNEPVDREEFIREHEKCAEGLRQFFEMMDKVEGMAGPQIRDTVEDRRSKRGEPNNKSPEPADNWEGRTLPFQFGRYEVRERLGRGGMGSVYLALDTHLARKVALKIPQFAKPNDLEWRDRFLREAKANVRHPNICTVYDSDIYEGQPFISMAYIDGPSLEAVINPENLLPMDEAAILVRIVATALESAHKAGIIHRDLKPSNIMLDSSGLPYVMDFGLAYRILGDDARLTPYGDMVGTPAYMSPEQIDGTLEGITKATDIYSLGVTFYELLTGRRPFQGPILKLIRQIQDQRPTAPSQLRPELDRSLDSICLRMMAKRPADRFASMEEVADAFKSWLGAKDSRSDVASELRSLRKQVKRLCTMGTVVAGGIGFLELYKAIANSPGPSDPGPTYLGGIDTDPKPNDGSWNSSIDQEFERSLDKADPVFGTPEIDRAFWPGQQSYPDTCAIRCQEHILQQFTGLDFPESQLIEEAKEHGWYTPGKGTPMDMVGNLLELHGVPVNRYTEANSFHLANELAQGHKVIVSVNSSGLRGFDSGSASIFESVLSYFGIEGEANHAVIVSGIDTTDPHHCQVIISDPSDGKAVARYPLEQFLRAWEGSHFHMVATMESSPDNLPEMVHFDYIEGHIDSIADVAFDDFVEQFADHPSDFDRLLDQYLQDQILSQSGLTDKTSDRNSDFATGDAVPLNENEDDCEDVESQSSVFENDESTQYDEQDSINLDTVQDSILEDGIEDDYLDL